MAAVHAAGALVSSSFGSLLMSRPWTLLDHLPGKQQGLDRCASHPGRCSAGCNHRRARRAAQAWPHRLPVLFVAVSPPQHQGRALARPAAQGPPAPPCLCGRRAAALTDVPRNHFACVHGCSAERLFPFSQSRRQCVWSATCERHDLP